LRSAEGSFVVGDIFYGLLGSGLDTLDGRGRDSHSLNDLRTHRRVLKERVGFKQ
jgi:hypothetical protein